MSTERRFLPYSRQTIEEEDLVAVSAALKSDFLTTGPRVEEFEVAFARAAGAKYAVACNSGTAALHLAALAANLQEGQFAIVPSITFLATANAVRMTGAEVIFADVDPDTGLMTAKTLADTLSQAKKAAVNACFPVHLNGQLCDMPALAAEARGILLIEDACHALGVADVGSTANSSMACFSTHAVKTIATGEGGCVTTADEKLAERMRKLRNHGMSRTARDFENRKLAFDGDEVNSYYYEMKEFGWNYRMPDILCALGISQLKKMQKFWERRREIAALYDRLLAPLSNILRPVPTSGPHGWHLYPILVDFTTLGISRRKFMDTLREQGIGTQVHYIPVHHQPYYQERYGEIHLPGADAYYSRCLSIPLFPAMSDDDVHHVAQTITRIVQKRV